MQLTRPVEQGAFGLVVHDAPELQAVQLPAALQTMFVPHEVPAGRFVPVSTQVCAPVLHEVTPVRQGLGFVEQEFPTTQGTQVPLPLHTWLLPHVVPAAVLPEPSTQVCVPVAHDVTPCLQTLGLVAHDVPAVQATQLALALHTMLVPQEVPTGFAAPLTHCWLPVLQEVMPK